MENIKELNKDPVYIFSDKAEAVPWILKFQGLLNKEGLGSQVVLSSDIFHLALGIRNCYPVKAYDKWTDLCLNRDKVLGIKFNAAPAYEQKELLDLILEKTQHADDYLEFYEF